MNEQPLSLEHRFTALSNGDDGQDWEGIRRRHRREQRFRALSAACVVLLAAIGAVPAVAFRSDLLDLVSGGGTVSFSSAERAPEQISGEFQSLESGAPRGLGPGVLPAEARRIASTRFGAGQSELYLSPTRDRGFCAVWTKVVTSCTSERAGHGVQPFQTGYTTTAGQPGVHAVHGTLHVPNASLRLLFADGASREINYVWVTEPIKAGFFLVEVPAARRSGPRRPTAVVLVARGREIARAPVHDVRRDHDVLTRFDEHHRQVQVTREAVWDRHRLALEFQATTGMNVALHVMPSRRGPGRRCYWTVVSFGCVSIATTRDSPLQLRLTPGDAFRPVLLFGEVAPRVAAVELRFEDGTQTAFEPQSGFVLAEITHDRQRRGHRPTAVVGYDDRGHLIARVGLPTEIPGVYP